jgi:hypothetical protein
VELPAAAPSDRWVPWEGARDGSLKATTRQRFPLPFVLTSFQRPKALIPMVKRPMRLRHGRG